MTEAARQGMPLELMMTHSGHVTTEVALEYIAEAKKFDPDGAYVRRWIPELAHLPDEHIHEPWRAPGASPDYPAPILDHGEARQRTLSRYAAVRGS